MALRFNKVIANTRESDHYCTPKEFYDKMDKEFGFTFDPCTKFQVTTNVDGANSTKPLL